MNKRTIRQRRPAESGQAIVLIALAMIGLLAFGILAIDGSRFFDQRRTTQNAADMASMAGTQMLFSADPSVTVTYDMVASEVNRVAELNGIPDTDGTANNNTNLNVEAYWIDNNGDYVGSTCPGGKVSHTLDPHANAACARVWVTGTAPFTASQAKPTAASGVMVRAKLPYTNFMAGLIGRKGDQSQADSTSNKIATVIHPHDDTPDAIDLTHTTVFLGGGNCPPGVPAFTLAKDSNANNFDFGGNAYINGSGTQGTGNSQQGLYKSGDGTANFSGSMTGLDKDGHVATGWVNPYSLRTPPLVYPKIPFYIKVNGVDQLITARDFNPDPSATDNYIYKSYVQQGSSPAGYFHSVTGSGPTNDMATNGDALATAMSSGGPGIYYVDGDVEVTTAWSATSGQALVATGRVKISVGTGSSRLGRADDASGWGLGLSVFADGTPPAGKSACTATSTSSSDFYPILWEGSQQVNWKGYLFVPHGLVSLSKNGNGGHDHGPIIANAFELGDGGNSNNIQFDECSDCFSFYPPTVTYTNGLVK